MQQDFISTTRRAIRLLKNQHAVTHHTRQQLTLFVAPEDADAIEQIRLKFNPEQFGLIKCHVTLCREDEIENLERVLTNLADLPLTEIVIAFGKAQRFANGNGLYLPVATDNTSFHDLRRQVLAGIIDNPGRQEPHITLMHPRNSTCTDHILEQVKMISLPKKLKFKKISLIVQENGGPWKALQEFELRGPTR